MNTFCNPNEAAPASPAWKTVPSWFVYGKADKNIPAEASAFMAKRAKAKKTVIMTVRRTS